MAINDVTAHFVLLDSDYGFNTESQTESFDVPDVADLPLRKLLGWLTGANYLAQLDPGWALLAIELADGSEVVYVSELGARYQAALMMKMKEEVS